MKLFSFFKKSKPKGQIGDTIADAPGYVCSYCGKFNPISFNFCPNCGKYCSSRDPYLEDTITAYLRKMGLLHLANQQYQIQIQLENGKKIAVPLIGRQHSNDVLAYLRSKGILSEEEQYHFPAWPFVDECWGPDYQHVSAFACELDTRRVYHVKSIKMEDIIVH